MWPTFLLRGASSFAAFFLFLFSFLLRLLSLSPSFFASSILDRAGPIHLIAIEPVKGSPEPTVRRAVSPLLGRIPPPLSPSSSRLFTLGSCRIDVLWLFVRSKFFPLKFPRCFFFPHKSLILLSTLPNFYTALIFFRCRLDTNSPFTSEIARRVGLS